MTYLQKNRTARRVAVIGGGVSGIATAKCLLDDGHIPVVFEKTDQIGGIWVYGLDRVGGVYATTVYQNTKYVSCFSDYPMSSSVSVFPRHDEILDYVRDYARHFRVDACIRLKTEVVRAIQQPDDSWLVIVRGPDGERSERFDALAVCTGYYWRPSFPDLPGLESFPGRCIHSAHYKSNEGFKDQRVVIVGGGVSGMDIASDVCRVALSTTWSVRSRHWIRPRWFGFIPYEAGVVQGVHLSREQMLEHWKKWIPDFYAKMEQAGWIPDIDPFAEGFGASDEILDCLLEGKVGERKAIVRVAGPTVFFEDGFAAEADALVFATGYDGYSFPFFEPHVQEQIGVHEEGVDLYREVFHPGIRQCAFLFHVSGNAPAMPTVELQARWFSMVLSGERQLPNPEAMREWIRNDRERRRKRYNKTSYRANFVDGEYVGELAEYIGVLPNKLTHWHDYLELVKPPNFPHIFRAHGPGRSDRAWDLIKQARDVYPVKSDHLTDLKQQILESLSRKDLLAMYRNGQLSREELMTIVSGGRLTDEAVPNAETSETEVGGASPSEELVAADLSADSGEEGMLALAERLRTMVAGILQLEPAEINLKGKFANYGFDSLTLNQFAQEIDQACGIKLQPNHFFEHATLIALSTYLFKTYGDRVASIGAASRPASPSPSVEKSVAVIGRFKFKPRHAPSASQRKGVLLPLKADGAEAPVFLVHPVGGSSFVYVGIAEALERLRPDLPVHALQSPGLFDDSPPLDSVQAMAKQYAADLIGMRRQGPFYVGGWSFGGVVAFELAHQLERAGHEVGRVLLIDSYAHTGASFLAQHDRVSLLRTYLTNVAEQKNLAGLGFAGGTTGQDYRALIQEGYRIGLFPSNMKEDAIEKLLEVYRVNNLAFESYRPDRIRAPISCLICSDHRIIGSDAEALAWERRTSSGFDVQGISGDHYSIMAAERAAEVAAWISSRAAPMAGRLAGRAETCSGELIA